ncbi:MAG: HU family DNA-binding protein [Patescibacteria group bacterium]
MAKVTKKDIVDHVAEKCDMTKADAERALECVVDLISSRLVQGDDVAIAGFGNFTTSQRAAREARNPRTGESVQVPAMRVPKFKPGKALKDAVR